MKILYIVNARIPTEKAHGIQIMKMCEAFSNLGHDVTLLVPWRFNGNNNRPFDYYRIEENFKIKRIFSIDLIKFGKFGFLIQITSFAVFSTIYSFFLKKDVIYSRDAIVLYFLTLFYKKTFYEVHDYPGKVNLFFNGLFSRLKWILATNDWKKKKLESDFPQTLNKVFVGRNGIDLKKFNIKETKEEVRNKLNFNFPKNKKIVVYTGHLYDWKGAQTLANSIEFLGDEFHFVFIGGTENDLKKFREQYTSKNISVVGFRCHSEMPLWQKAADILVLPNTAKEDISKYYTSPMKLFEYMASGTPITASDLPSIREILNEENSTLVEPDNPKALAEGIMIASSKDGKKALTDVEQYTWEKRAKNIICRLKVLN